MHHRAAGPSRFEASAGFTLVEMCWTIAIFAVVAAVGVVPMHRWAAAERLRSTTSSVEATLRETQQRSVTEGRALCVDFDLAAGAFSVLRGACGATGQVRLQGPVQADAGVRFLEVAFTYGGGTTRTGATFYPRGTATPGTLRIVRDSSNHEDLLTLDGLTGRVSRA